MKKIIIAIILLFCMAQPSYAAYTNEFGGKSCEFSFDSVTEKQLGGFPYAVNATLSEEEAITGKSLVMTTGDMETGEEKKLGFSYVNTMAFHEYDNFFVEIAVKGFDEIPDNLYPYFINDFTSNVPIIKSGTEKLENGWIKMWYTVPRLEGYVTGTGNGLAGFKYEKAEGDPEKIWFDNFAMRPIPDEIKIYPTCVNSNCDYDLCEIDVDGIGASGEIHRLENTKFMKWTVISGDCQVFGTTLHFTSNQPQTVVLEGDFFGCTDRVEIETEPAEIITPDEPVDDSEWNITADCKSSGNQFTVDIKNDGKDDATVCIITATFLDGRLYKTVPSFVSVNAGDKEEFTCYAPEIPAGILGNATYKCYVWSDLVGGKTSKGKHVETFEDMAEVTKLAEEGNEVTLGGGWTIFGRTEGLFQGYDGKAEFKICEVDGGKALGILARANATWHNDFPLIYCKDLGTHQNKNYEYSFDFKNTQNEWGDTGCGIRFNYVDRKNYYELYFTSCELANGDGVALGKMVNSSYIVLDENVTKYKNILPERWYTVNLSVSDGVMSWKVYEKGTDNLCQTGTVDDSQNFLSANSMKTCFFSAGNGGISSYIDNVSVNEL